MHKEDCGVRSGLQERFLQARAVRQIKDSIKRFHVMAPDIQGGERYNFFFILFFIQYMQ